jgi:anti-sigma regulatory factor (Ser/Thr protein kinase)
MAVSTHGEEPAAVLSLALEQSSEAPAVARAAIVGFCEGRDVGSTALSTLMLLVSEVVTNAVTHPDATPTESIGFSAHAYPDYIRVEVTDQGSGFTPRPRDPAQVGGGYGLYLLEKAAQGWGVTHHDETTVWFEVSTVHTV